MNRLLLFVCLLASLLAAGKKASDFPETDGAAGGVEVLLLSGSEAAAVASDTGASRPVRPATGLRPGARTDALAFSAHQEPWGMYRPSPVSGARLPFVACTDPGPAFR